MRPELRKIVDQLSKGDADITLDALGEAIGARSVSAEEIDEMLREIEKSGRKVTSPDGGKGEESLKVVLATARQLRAELGRAPRAAEIAARAGIGTDEVEHALALAKVIQR